MDARFTRRDLMRTTLAAGGSLALGGFAGRRALAMDLPWTPERPIRTVVQYAAGGGTDVAVRAIMAEAAKVLGQQINVINMPGAVGSVALQYGLDQPHDGYTWLGTGGFTDFPRILGIQDTVSWRDWQWFTTNNSYASWSASPSTEFKTFQNVVDYAKANPGKLRVGTDGEGGLWHEAMLMVATRAGFTFTNVPFDGGAPATLAAIQQEVDITGTGLHEQIQFIRAGQLTNLAVFSKEPIDAGNGLVLRPISEFVPEAAVDAPFGGVVGVAVPRDVPAEVLQSMSIALQQALESESVTELLDSRFMGKFFQEGAVVDEWLARLETRRAALFHDIGLAKRSPEELGLPAPEEFDGWWPPEGYSPAI